MSAQRGGSAKEYHHAIKRHEQTSICCLDRIPRKTREWKKKFKARERQRGKKQATEE